LGKFANARVHSLAGEARAVPKSNLVDAIGCTLRRRAAEGAGEGRGDVGADDDLLGRFFGRHFLAGRRRDAAWRID
jgi:hypothetical protein